MDEIGGPASLFSTRFWVHSNSYFLLKRFCLQSWHGFCAFGGLATRSTGSERREEKVSSVIGDHQDLVSKRDEFQLVKRQGPACLAIASYSVKRYKRLRIACTALHCVSRWEILVANFARPLFYRNRVCGGGGTSSFARKYQYMWQLQDGQLIEPWRLLQDLSCREKGRVSFKIFVSDGESGRSQVEKTMEQPAGSWRSSNGCQV